MSDRGTREAERKANATSRDVRAPEQKTQRTCLLVLGMHRSGTSALARVLNIAGAKLPLHLIGAAEGNEVGHWEPARLVDYNDELLRKLGSRWDDWSKLQINTIPLKQQADVKCEIKELVSAEFGDATLFVLKDPRISRLAPLYLDALVDTAINVRPLIAFRNPLEVVQSLEVRRAFWSPEKSRADASLLWLRHMLDAEAATRSMRRVFVSYGSLLADWKPAFANLTKTLNINWPHTVRDIANQVDEFLTPAQRHHAISTEEVLLDPLTRNWIGEAYEALLVLERNPVSVAALETFDRIRREFEHAAPVIAQYQAQMRAMNDVAAHPLRATLSEANVRVEALATQVAERDAQLDEQKRLHDADLNKLNGMLSAAISEAEVLSGKLAERETQLQEQARAFATANSSAEVLFGQLAEREAQLQERTQAYVSADGRIKELSSQLAEREDQLRELTSARAAAEHRASVIIASLKSHVADANRMRKLLSEAETAARSLEVQLQASVEENALATARESSLREELDVLTTRSEQVAAALNERDSDIRRFSDAIAAHEAEKSRLLLEANVATKRAEELNKTLAELEFEKSNFESRLAALMQHHASMRDEYESAKATLAAVHSSTSWRISAPIRAIKKLLLGLARFPGSIYRRTVNRAYAIWRSLPFTTRTKQFLKSAIFYAFPCVFYRTQPYRLWRESRLIARRATALQPSIVPAPKQPESKAFQTDAALEPLNDTSAYVPLLNAPPLADKPVRVIAFYLPQFHPIAENDIWWGKGFTEWTNVTSAIPQFAGHYQPRRPGELGYYDLRVSDVQRRQVELAKLYGIEAFCFYFYWFAGRTLLEIPTENFRSNSDLDFPYCICWANENWSRRWDGLDQEILIAQSHSPEDDTAFISHVSKYLRDPRYVRIDGRPLLIVYRPNLLPDARQTAERWRQWCRQNNVGEIYIAYTQSFESSDPSIYGFDGAIEFPPNNIPAPVLDARKIPNSEGFEGIIRDWTSLALRSEHYVSPAYDLFRGVCPSWDNTARRKNKGSVYLGSTPELFQQWMENAIVDTCKRFPNPGQRLVFVNAWNEWAEGAYLEPDERMGYAWLQAIRSSLERNNSSPSKRIVLVSHDAHPHGAQFLALNLAKTLKNKFGFAVDLVLLGPGSLRERMAEVATLHDLAPGEVQSPAATALATRLREGGARAAICNTTVSGHFVGVLKNAGFQTLSLVHELPQIIKAYNLADAADKLAKCADKVVFPADSVGNSFQCIASVDATKAVIRPQGLYKRNRFRSAAEILEAGRSLRRQLNIKASTKIILGVGFADERKGFDLFIGLAEHMRRLQSDVLFLWVGNLDLRWQNSFRDWIRNLESDGYLVLAGFSDDSDPYYAGADVYLLTSREDPYPSTVLESLDTGLPVVGFEGATGTTGLILEHGGKLVPAFDLEAMAEALNQILSEESSGRRGERALKFRQRPDVSFQAYVNDLLALVEEAPKSVSVVLPNYNYARYLPERIKNIVEQTYPIRELIVLDDASTDSSVEVILRQLELLEIPARIIANSANSGSVSHQWLRGAEAATGEYLWIAEADDLAEPDFLATVIKEFDDRDVSISYCQSKQMAEDGSILCENYLDYVKDVSSTQWLGDYKRSGREEIVEGLSIKNTIPNVSAVVFRREALCKAMRSELKRISSFRVAGDWCTYVALLRHGSCSFTAKSLNRHRRHTDSVTINRFGASELDEIARMQEFVAGDYQLKPDLAEKAEQYLVELSRQFGLQSRPRRG